MAVPQTPQPFNLEEFAIHHAINAKEWHLPFVDPLPLPDPITLHGLMLLFAAAFVIFIFCFVYKKNQTVPSGITNFLESFVLFIRDDIAIPTLGPDKGRTMAPILCTFFFFILSMNLMGMIPLFVSPTANINVTGALAFITLCMMIFTPISKKGFIGFLKSFIIPDMPIFVLIILVPLEILGLFFKTFALMIRLFANMFGGHLVILSLLGLVGLFGFIAVPSILLALFVSLIELFVAFLQAYIFTLLSAFFVAQTTQEQH